MFSATVSQPHSQSARWALALALLCAMAAGSRPAHAENAPPRTAQKEKTPAENVQIAKTPSRDEEERTKAIENLARVSNDTERDNRVIEALLDIVKNDTNMFIRIASVKALGDIQSNVTKGDGRAKTKYIVPFVEILKKKENHSALRIAVANVFGQTLERDGKDVKDLNDAYPALKEVAKAKGEPLGLRKACILAIGEFGSADAIEVLAAVLNEGDTGDMRESAVHAIDVLLSKVAESVALSVPTVNKLVDMLRDKNVPDELKIAVMKLMARLIRENNTTARNEAFPVILEMVDPLKAKNDLLLVAGVECLGIIGSAEVVVPLKKTYDAYFDARNAQKTGDVAVRQPIMRALRSVLSVQGGARTPDTKAVHEATTLLVKAIDDDAAVPVKSSAAYALRYVYKFDAEHKETVTALVYLLNSTRDEELKKNAVETLNFITGLGYTDEPRRWFEYIDKKYPGGARKKDEKEKEKVGEK